MVRANNFSFSPGQALEFRLRLNVADSKNQAGLLPAIWSSDWAGGGWPIGGKLDYFELAPGIDPHEPFFSAHYQGINGGTVNRKGAIDLGKNFSGQWHTIRVEYRPEDITWFVDDQLTYQFIGENLELGAPTPFNQEITNLNINLGIGGEGGQLDTEALDRSRTNLRIDYIEVSNL